MCDDESLIEIPTEKIPQNLKYLKISGTNISSVEAHDFKDKSIETLSLSGNKINTLDRCRM